jgi:hypothetical protein
MRFRVCWVEGGNEAVGYVMLGDFGYTGGVGDSGEERGQQPQFGKYGWWSLGFRNVCLFIGKNADIINDVTNVITLFLPLRFSQMSARKMRQLRPSRLGPGGTNRT